MVRLCAPRISCGASASIALAGAAFGRASSRFLPLHKIENKKARLY
jgi:hypothetical protein